MDYREFTPSARLTDYVECYWTLEGHAPALPRPERILPDGRAELVWNLADPFLRHRPGALPVRQASSLVVGQITTPFLLQATGRIELVAVRFRPAGLGAFLDGIPAHLLTDMDYAIDDVAGSRLSTFAEAVAAAPTAERRVGILDACLREELRQAAPVDRRAAAAVATITAAHGMVRVDDMAALVGLGSRQLERLFRTHVGIGPKRLARIMRFQRLVSGLDGLEPDGWARIAIRCGYYDQAHLIRDFREFTGGPPAGFRRNGEDTLTEVFLREG